MIIKNKRGISVMIGYIFLITITIIISTIVYQQLRTYVPTEKVECPEGVSVFLKKVVYDCDNKELNITLKNNGRFSVAGYFIAATNKSDQELATIDLSKYTKSGVGGFVIFDFLSQNSMSPNKEIKSVFDLSSSSSQFYSLNIIPVRYQEIENRNRIVSCGDSRIKETLTCFEKCVPKTCIELNFVCGNNWDDGCGGILDCGTCTDPEVCTSIGQCVPPLECTDTCSSFGYQCGNQTICGASVDCTVEIGGCDQPTESCNEVTGQCEITCGNGFIDTDEQCDDGVIPPVSGDGCSSTCTIEDGWICSGQPSDCEPAPGSFNSCGDYCALFGYSSVYTCEDNDNKCAPPQGPEGGTYIGNVEDANETFGNSFCLADPFCCCRP